MDLAYLKSELSKRLKYGDEKKEAEYQSKIKEINNNYPDEGWRIPESYRNEISELKNNKLREIRKYLNDDDGFNRLKNKLENVEADKETKELELKNLVPPKQPNRLQKVYTTVSGKINTADAEINDFNNKIKDIKEQIYGLKKIIGDIKTLIPIYEEPNEEVQTGGSKTKTRRNRNSNKSRKNRRKLTKNRRKSNCRY